MSKSPFDMSSSEFNDMFAKQGAANEAAASKKMLDAMTKTRSFGQPGTGVNPNSAALFAELTKDVGFGRPGGSQPANPGFNAASPQFGSTASQPEPDNQAQTDDGYSMG